MNGNIANIVKRRFQKRFRCCRFSPCSLKYVTCIFFTNCTLYSCCEQFRHSLLTGTSFFIVAFRGHSHVTTDVTWVTVCPGFLTSVVMRLCQRKAKSLVSNSRTRDSIDFLMAVEKIQSLAVVFLSISIII